MTGHSLPQGEVDLLQRASNPPTLGVALTLGCTVPQQAFPDLEQIVRQ